MRRLKLIAPHWHGSGDDKIAVGCHTLAAQVAGDDYKVIDAVRNDGIETTNIRNYGSVLAGLQSIKTELDISKPKEVFTLGGDCGIELPLVSYLANLYGGDLGIVWLDAHGDANTPQTSPSGYFHGMPIRCLCGEGDKHIRATGFSCINPKSLAYVGARDLDPPEAQWMADKNIFMSNKGNDLLEHLRERKFKKVFIHLDFDVIDPVEFSAVSCPTANGLSVKYVAALLVELSKNFEVVGATLTECTARNKTDLQPVAPILDWWKQEAEKNRI